MKKAIALILSLMLAIASAAACAENLEWKDGKTDDVMPAGEFHTFEEAGLKAWIPSYMDEVELTEEDRTQGFLAYFSQSDNSHMISAVYVDTGSLKTQEEYGKALEGVEGVSDISAITVNGLPAVFYNLKENETSTVTIIEGNGKVFELTVYPATGDENLAAALYVFSSIQAE